MSHHSASDCGCLNFAQFKGERSAHMFLLDRSLADVELTCLAVVISKPIRPGAQLLTLFFGSVGLKAALRRFARTPKFPTPRVRLIVNSGAGINQGHMTVLLKSMKRAFRRIDRQTREIRTSQPFKLGVQVGKITPLEQRVITEINAGHYILRTKCNLFRLRKEIVDAAVEHQPSHSPYGNLLLRNDLGRVQNVEREIVSEFFIE